MIARHKRAPGTQSEDLGRQTTSGYAALGPRQGYEPGSDWFSTGARYSEMWCSDSLGAVVRQAHGREWRNGEESSNESTMQNIERANPILHSSKSPRTTLSSNAWREIATSRRLPMLSSRTPQSSVARGFFFQHRQRHFPHEMRQGFCGGSGVGKPGRASCGICGLGGASICAAASALMAAGAEREFSARVR